MPLLRSRRALALLALALCAPLAGQEPPVRPAVRPGLRVVGAGEVAVAMGRVRLVVRVSGAGETSEDARAQSSARRADVLARLRAIAGRGSEVRPVEAQPESDSLFDVVAFGGLLEVQDVEEVVHSHEDAFAFVAEPSAGQALVDLAAEALDAARGIQGVFVEAPRYLPANAQAAERRALAAAFADARARADGIAVQVGARLGRPLSIDATAVAGLIPATGFDHPGARVLTLRVPIRFALLD